jgi:hypothetical protein
MKWLVIFGVLAACNGGGGSSDAPDPTCPDRMPGNFDRCTASPADSCGYGAYRCVCSGAQGWLCSSCPDNFRDMTCTPQTTCEWSDPERDCSCVCASNSRWDCSQDTSGTPYCPHAFDAGVP